MASENDSTHLELDLSNPRSLVSLVSESFRDGISKIPDEFLNKKEREIIDLCYSDEKDGYPPPLDAVLRRNFWDEYNRTLADELPAMNMTNIYRDVCSHATFSAAVKNPRRLAFIITEPSYDKMKSQYALDCVWTKVMALAKMEPERNSKTGLPDSKVYDLQLKLFQFLEQQKHGSLIQRIKQETTSTNVNVAVDANKPLPGTTEDDINNMIAILKEKLAQTPQAPVPQIANEPKLVLPIEQAHRDAKKAEVER